MQQGAQYTGGVVEEGDEAVTNWEVRGVDCADGAKQAWSPHAYGTIGCGLEAMSVAWENIEHVFSVNGRKDSRAKHVIPGGPRFPTDLFERYPVEVVVNDVSYLDDPGKMEDHQKQDRVLRAIGKTSQPHRPKIVVESWCEEALTWKNGPVTKAERVRWEDAGYDSRFKRVAAVDVGGAINQGRLLIARVQVEFSPYWTWEVTSPVQTPRPMSNLLLPAGLIPRTMYVPEGKLPPGTFVSRYDVDAMPSQPNSWIETERGIRRLMGKEYARGLGLLPHQIPERVDHRMLKRTTSLFHWEYVGRVMASSRFNRTEGTRWKVDWNPTTVPRVSATHKGGLQPDPPEFIWKPPDLAPGGAWHAARMANLRTAASRYPNGPELIESGVEALRIHRQNYTDAHPDPKRLQILWWEFPEEHWDALREGSRMNFMTVPEAGIHENSKMDEEQVLVAAQFIDELVELATLQPPPPSRPTVTTAPLFCVPKEGQPGQWRVIADMLSGGQNACVVADPVYLNRPSHILDQMYAGGYTAVVDASKFFYQFLTHPDDRPYLGVLHPITHQLLEYLGLPMGSSNSPALACRYGIAFLRKLRETFTIFQGSPTANCWWTGFQDLGYDPALGYGMLLLRSDGLPAVRLWAHVDDFAIHGPDLASTTTALRHFLDTAVVVGLLCHPGKLAPPQQVAKYVGFLFDTHGIPTLRVPLPKRERALAMLEYTLGQPGDYLFSRLGLSVVAGVLESLTEATPSRLGHTYLRALHSAIHPEGLVTNVYYTRTTLSPEIRADLQWWRHVLLADPGRAARTNRSATLIPTFGDGSGSGTGGTLGFDDRGLEMWMGQWSPTVYHFSSNWKELKTLHLTLTHISRHHREKAVGTTLFYFTDNSVTYWIAASGSSRSPGLHYLIEQIKLLELDLGCCLQVIHVPGTVMIQQGTDGLSRGVWCTLYHRRISQRVLTVAVFAPLQYDPALVQEYLIRVGHGTATYRLQEWDTRWEGLALLHQMNVWFPPPELARQAIIFTLEAWVEAPLTTSALFFVPRTVPSFWHGLSRHLTEVDCFLPSTKPLALPPLLSIPIVVLYLPRHERVLPLSSPPHRVDTDQYPSVVQWHEEQASLVRGLPPVPIHKP